MRCEEVRPLLPDLAEGGPRPVGPVEVHLSTCQACTANLQRYRAVILELAAMQDETAEPPEGFLDRLLADLPEAHRRRLLARVAADERVQAAALSIGGAVVGASAIGLLWWRARRAVKV
jgi:predicted anti-sigma-YlaC factor YlaD